MLKPSNTRERYALKIAILSADIAGVEIQETIGEAWLIAYRANDAISPKRRKVFAKSIALSLKYIVEEVDVAPQIASFSYFDNLLEQQHRRKLAAEAEIALARYSRQQVAAFEHQIDIDYADHNKKQLAGLLGITRSRCADLSHRSQIERIAGLIRRRIRGPDSQKWDYRDYQPDIDSTCSVL